ncbi:MAG: glycine zipper 2TM domain-containing protein [Erythrobacter sp.]
MKILAPLAAASTLAVIAAPAQAATFGAPSQAPAITAPAPIAIDHAPTAQEHHRRNHNRNYRSGNGHGQYDSNGRYREPRRISRQDRVWRGRDGRYYCQRDNGTTGLVIGAGVGALIGNEVAGRGDSLLGTIIGGVAGGLLGREIDRGNTRCR